MNDAVAEAIDKADLAKTVDDAVAKAIEEKAKIMVEQQIRSRGSKRQETFAESGPVIQRTPSHEDGSSSGAERNDEGATV